MGHLTATAIDELTRVLALSEKDTGVLTKWRDCESELLKCGAATKRIIHVSEILCHPDNRSGLGINWFNADRNIRMIKSVGVDWQKLIDATCFEISTDPELRTNQLDCNRKQIANSEGFMAPSVGNEMYLSVATGHIQCPAAVQ